VAFKEGGVESFSLSSTFGDLTIRDDRKLLQRERFVM
jgi:hypothetical protein